MLQRVVGRLIPLAGMLPAFGSFSPFLLLCVLAWGSSRNECACACLPGGVHKQSGDAFEEGVYWCARCDIPIEEVPLSALY